MRHSIYWVSSCTLYCWQQPQPAASKLVSARLYTICRLLQVCVQGKVARGVCCGACSVNEIVRQRTSATTEAMGTYAAISLSAQPSPLAGQSHEGFHGQVWCRRCPRVAAVDLHLSPQRRGRCSTYILSWLPVLYHPAASAEASVAFVTHTQ